MRRREFLCKSAAAALGLPFLPACRHRELASDKSTNDVLWPKLIAELEQRIPLWMQEYKVPGLSIAVIKNARVAWRHGFGVKDSTSREPVDHDTLFEAASMSKPVFAYAVMKLWEKSLLNLDTPLTRYTSERFLEGDPRLDRITARHLLSHTSGLPNWRSSEKPFQTDFATGERWQYSGEGYFYLQSVVTHLTGRVQPADCDNFEGDVKVCATDFDPFMRANLLVPLGLRSSGYLWDNTWARRMARAHDAGGKPNGKPYVEKTPNAAAIARYGSAGALLTTPTDYARFLIAVIAPRPADACRLRRTSIEEMLRPHVKLDGQHPSSWALGWQIFHNQRDFIYHGGDNKGFHCGALASVEGRCGYVVMTNGDQGPEALRKLITDDLMQRFLNESKG